MCQANMQVMQSRALINLFVYVFKRLLKTLAFLVLLRAINIKKNL